MIALIKTTVEWLATITRSNTNKCFMIVGMAMILVGCATPTVTTIKQNNSTISQVFVTNNTLYISGDIDFITVATVGQQNTDHVTTVALTSHGGSVNLALMLSSWIKSKSLNTTVSDYCESACTLILASGERRSASHTARFLIHGAANNLKASTNQDTLSLVSNDVNLANQEMRVLYLERGINPDFINKSVRSPRPANEHIISAVEALHIGLLTDIYDN